MEWMQLNEQTYLSIIGVKTFQWNGGKMISTKEKWITNTAHTNTHTRRHEQPTMKKSILLDTFNKRAASDGSSSHIIFQ